MVTGKIHGFFSELGWNLKENFFSKWFAGIIALLMFAGLILTYLTSLALLKVEVITSSLGIAAYLLTLAAAVIIPAVIVAAISAVHAIKHERAGNLTILGDFMGGLKLGTWLFAPFKLFATGLRAFFLNLKANSAEQIKIIAAGNKRTQPIKYNFIAVEISMIEINAEIKDIVTKLYQDLEKHFQHRDLELQIYESTIRELGSYVDPELELERKLLWQEWQNLKTLADDSDPSKFFNAVEHYLNDTANEIGDIERLLDEKYDLDAERNSLFFRNSSQHDTEDVRADLAVLRNPDRGGFRH